jgi:hypothetical protein
MRFRWDGMHIDSYLCISVMRQNSLPRNVGVETIGGANAAEYAHTNDVTGATSPASHTARCP